MAHENCCRDCGANSVTVDLVGMLKHCGFISVEACQLFPCNEGLESKRTKRRVSWRVQTRYDARRVYVRDRDIGTIRNLFPVLPHTLQLFAVESLVRLGFK